MSGHTPGPWVFVERLSGSENHRGFCIASESEGFYHTEVMPVDEDGKEGRANARLIAAAPDGLEAAITAYQSLLTVTSTVWRMRNMKAYCDLRDFIAKATGQTAQEMQEHYEELAVIAKATGGQP